MTLLLQIYSEDGIYRIEKNKIFRLIPQDKSIKTLKTYYKHYTLLCDSSSFTKEQVLSQIPFDYVLVETVLKYFCLGNEERKVASLYLVVSENKETGEIQDFYFLTAENLTEKIEEDRLLQEELAVFLELLF